MTTALERMTSAVGAIADQRRELKVICACTFANRRLVPRLRRFQAAYPDTAVSVGLFQSGYSDFYSGNYDLGIDCFLENSDRPPELEAVLIRREQLTPACAPALLEAGPPLTEPDDLAAYTLLHSYNDVDWQHWLSAAGAHNVDGTTGHMFATAEMAIKAAAASLGIAICDRHFIESELATGQLVAPFELVVSDNTGYFLFAERGRMREPVIAAFRDWVTTEVHGAPFDASFNAGVFGGAAK